MPPCSATVLRLVEAIITGVDWLANFSDYGVTTKLRELKLQSRKISFQNSDMTFL